ncbi:MFS transporter [Lysobacter enzymogenes]|uniref:MFS transporter n=1 Tax=Lysobacter enzymogenes TaxID=69 RepID=UPI003747D733
MRPDAPADKRHPLLPLVLSCALFIENMDSSALATSLPAIAADLGTDAISLKLALTAYLLAVAMFMPVSGWIADRIGARRAFLAAVGLFLLGSAACALSASAQALVAARFLQGTGGALMVPVGRLVLLRAVPKSELVRAMSWLTIPALIGPMIGPPLGGFITTYFDWRGIFLINIPIGLLGIALAKRVIPDVREPPPPLDRLGLALTAPGLAAAMFGFASLGQRAVPVAASVAALAVGAGLLAGYAVHAARHPHPLLELRLLRIETYRAGVVGGSLFRVGVGATVLLVPLMLQLGFGLDPLQTGLLVFVSSIGAMSMKLVVTPLLRRFGFRRALLGNVLVASALVCGFGLFRAQTPHLWLAAALFAVGCSRSLQFTSLNAISFAEVDARAMASATSLAGTMVQLSLSLGVVVGAHALELAAAATGRPVADPLGFRIAFAVVAAISLASAWSLWRLRDDAGSELSGHVRAGAHDDAGAKP